MLRFAQLCESIGATTKKTEKVTLVADYLRTTPVEESALGALYLCGRVFPRREERVLSIGFSILLRAVARIAKKDSTELAPVLRHHGDLGAGAEEILRDHPVGSSLSLPQIAEVYASLSLQRRAAAKQTLLEHTLQCLSALEAKYFIKIATGELRIGLKESLVEEAIAKAFDQTLPAVQRANMLLGDITEVLRLAVAHSALLEGADDLTRLALDLGFASPAHFSAAFRTAYGCSPSTVRKRRSRRDSTQAPS